MRVKKILILCITAALIVGVVAALSGCGGSTTSTGDTGAKKLKIALLLPETKTARYETQDKPLFEAKVKELAPDAEILYSNANQDAALQQSQADAALTNGAKCSCSTRSTRPPRRRSSRRRRRRRYPSSATTG